MTRVSIQGDAFENPDETLDEEEEQEIKFSGFTAGKEFEAWLPKIPYAKDVMDLKEPANIPTVYYRWK